MLAVERTVSSGVASISRWGGHRGRRRVIELLNLGVVVVLRDMTFSGTGCAHVVIMGHPLPFASKQEICMDSSVSDDMCACVIEAAII